MILVTVGTSLPDDRLIKAVDELVGSSRIGDEVWAQIGTGLYIPKHLKWFRFARSLEKLYDRVDVVVSNCGAGTILENTIKGRRLVAIQNPNITGGHEWELVEKMEKGGHLIWCRSIDYLNDCIERARSAKFAVLMPEKLDVAKLFLTLGYKGSSPESGKGSRLH
jgi:UDP-N-acetylglucosamine transferase subunit ALG13